MGVMPDDSRAHTGRCYEGIAELVDLSERLEKPTLG